MEVNFKETVEDVKQFLIENGEDPNDYSDKELQHMLDNGF